MCGIAGFVHFADGPGAEDAGTLTRLSQALAHRGPDGWGRTLLSGHTVVEVSPRGARQHARAAGAGPAPVVGFAHCRLSIIDLTEGGHQPMVDELRGTFAIVGVAAGLAAFDGAARYARRAGTLGQS